MGDITRLLGELEAGGSAAINRLLPLVYDELQVLVRREKRAGSPDAAGTTSIVHEAYIKLARQKQVDWQSRAQFFYLAAQVIRSILIDNARHAARLKRGGGVAAVTLDPDLLSTTHDEALLELDAALNRLREHDARCYEVVICRFFGGMDVDETAEALAVSSATVKRDWSLARAWLYRELTREGPA